MENLATFALAALVFVVVPGPSVLFVVGRSVALGRRGGLLSVLGNSLGTVPVILAVALGIGAIVASSAIAFTVIRILGAGYLIYLGIQAIRHRHSSGGSTNPSAASPSRILGQGFIVGLTNPKSLAFFVAVLPQFVSPAGGPAWAQLLILGLLLQGIGLALDSAWALAAGSARAWFVRSPRRSAALAGAGGVMMIGLGGALAVSGSGKS